AASESKIGPMLEIFRLSRFPDQDIVWRDRGTRHAPNSHYSRQSEDHYLTSRSLFGNIIWGMEGVSATSAGAMNAAVMAHGLTTGGRKGAREALEEFWHGVARISAPFGALQLFEVMSRFLSPYQLNPFNYNPLRQLIRRVIDFERLRQGSAVKL